MKKEKHDSQSPLRTSLVVSKKHLNGRSNRHVCEAVYRPIQKRQKITNHTVVIGIDIGSEFNAVCLMDKEGDMIRLRENPEG